MTSVEFDVVTPDYPNQDDLAYVIVQALQAKGFCVIDSGADVDQCSEAVEEIHELQAMFKFAPPPVEVLDGLLGKDGSAGVFEFDPEEHSRSYSSLTRFDKFATSMGRLLENEVQALGIELAHRTNCLVHETGQWDKNEAAALTESSVEDWLNTFVYHKLMAIQFLGPGDDATLEMEYLAMHAERPTVDGEDEDDMEEEYVAVAETSKFSLAVKPGAMVLLRPDVLGHVVSGSQGNLALTTFFLPPGRKGPTRGGTLPELTPCARKLDAWSMQRLAELASAPRSADPDTPLEQWRVVSNAAFIMDAPREINKGGDRLEIARKGDLHHGTVEIVAGLRWLKVLTTVTDDYGRPRPGYILIDGEKVGVGKLIEKVEDMTIDWKIAMDHQYITSASPPVVVRSMAIKSANTHSSENMWTSSPACPDFVTEVPSLRWDHNVGFYGQLGPQDPQYSKHGTFMDGIDLFDNKLFAVSNAEVISMDPHQRLALEAADEALKRAGLEKKDLMRSVGGVYLGGGNAEWGYVPKTYDASADMYGCTGGSGAIQANRISFNLGLMGPSLVFIADEVSALLAVERGHMSFHPSKVMNIRCVSVGTSLNLSPFSWVRNTRIGVMCNQGYHKRMRAFDETAAGFIRGEAVGALHLTALTDTIDGVQVRDDTKTEEGLITGSALLFHSQDEGRGHPHAPTEKEVIALTCRQAGICPASLDLVEGHAEGRLLVDACEAYSLDSVTRKGVPEGGEDVPLLLTTYHANIGVATEATNIMVIIRMLKGAQYGAAGAMPNLRVLNPHIEVESMSVQFLDETLPFRMRQSIVAHKGMSIGGTQGMMTFAVSAEDEHVEPCKPIQNPSTKIAFWPGGGGLLEDSSRPRRGYDVIGSWDGWEKPIEMVEESQSGELTTYSAIVTLGLNRWEMFQILIDADQNKVLHPGMPKASQNVPVCGPDPKVLDWNWLIDGHSYGGYFSADEDTAIDREEPDFQPLAVSDLSIQPADIPPVPKAESVHVGRPGDQYCIKLHIAGKWRTVSWAKVETTSRDDQLAAFTDDSVYYVVASWNGWSLDQPMAKADGTSFLEVKLWESPGEFQIVRNRDWNQAFCPLSFDGGPAYGPAEYMHGQNWALGGKPGDVFRIEFQRKIEGDEDVSSVSWRCLRSEAAPLEDMPPPLYYLCGTMDTGREGKLKMDYVDDAEPYCVCTVEVGSSGQESFQVLVNGDWSRAMSPDRPDANPYEDHALRGPHTFGAGFSWTIGSHAEEADCAGDRFEVKVRLRSTFGRSSKWAYKVEWRRL